MSPAGDRALITVRDDVKQIYARLPGPVPDAGGAALPAGQPAHRGRRRGRGAGAGYVAQKHPEGRITFVTLDSGDARTLTGFELGARVVDWSQP